MWCAEKYGGLWVLGPTPVTLGRYMVYVDRNVEIHLQTTCVCTSDRNCMGDFPYVYDGN